MKRQLTSILLFSALLMGGASTFVSCTDHESDAAYEVTGTVADQVKKQATELENLVTKLDFLLKGGTTPEDVKKNLNQTIFGKDLSWDNAKLDVLQQALDAAKKEAENAKKAANAYTDKRVDSLAQVTLSLDQAISALTTTVNNNKTELNQLNTKVDNYANELMQMLDSYQAGNTEMFNNLNNLYNDMDVRLQEDENRIANLEEAVSKGATKEYVDAQLALLNTKIEGNTTDIETAKAAIEKNKQDIATNKTAIENIKNDLVNYATKQDLDDKAASLKDAFEKADKALEDKMQAQIDDINKKLNALFNTMLNMLTGIELQATESPITGYENFSFLGAEAHILGTYYGTTAKPITLGEEKIAKANQVLIDETSGENAGVIYATLNPSNVDFTGCTLKVVNSQGEEAPFTATVVKSNRVLKYGVSRASNSNLYAIKINLNEENLEAAKTWTSSDAAALKDVAKNVLDKLRQPGTTRLNIGDAATTIARTFNNRLTAYALQAEQKYTDANGKEQTRTITSKMSLAATAIKPVSFNFLKDNETLKNLDLPSFPTIQSKLNFNDYKFNWTPIEGLGTVKTSVTLKDMPDIDNIKVTIDGVVQAPKVNVEKATISFGKTELQGTVTEDGKHVIVDLSELEKNTTADVKVSIGDIKINPNDVKVTLDTSATKDMTYDVEIPMDEFNKIIDNINKQVGNMIGNVNNIIDKVNNYAETIDGQYITGINNYIQKFENLLRKSNSLLQPAMFYVTNSGSWGQLAREDVGASYLKLQGGKASTVLVASSYTGEIFAPAFKKYVHVTSAPTGAHVTGTNLNKVIDGNLHKIGFEADKEGTYEITYEAVDYSGVKVAKKFYVKVVK